MGVEAILKLARLGYQMFALHTKIQRVARIYWKDLPLIFPAFLPRDNWHCWDGKTDELCAMQSSDNVGGWGVRVQGARNLSCDRPYFVSCQHVHIVFN